jgi:type IV pilus biogenesis protein PilP
LTRIEAETMVLKARERQLDIQAKIIARQNEIAARQAETDRVAQAPVVGNPVIRSIEGIGRTMYATLQTDSGSIIDVKVGDFLPNGAKVTSISTNEVIVETPEKKRIRLAAVSHTRAAFDPSFPSPAVRLPPMLPLAPPRGAMR